MREQCSANGVVGWMESLPAWKCLQVTVLLHSWPYSMCEWRSYALYALPVESDLSVGLSHCFFRLRLFALFVCFLTISDDTWLLFGFDTVEFVEYPEEEQTIRKDRRWQEGVRVKEVKKWEWMKKYEGESNEKRGKEVWEAKTQYESESNEERGKSAVKKGHTKLTNWHSITDPKLEQSWPQDEWLQFWYKSNYKLPPSNKRHKHWWQEPTINYSLVPTPNQWHFATYLVCGFGRQGLLR